MRVFITGATGFIGSHLVQALNSRGIRPDCMVRTEPKWLEGMDFTSVNCDSFVEPAAIRSIGHADAVFYLAGVTKADSYHDYVSGNFDAFTDFYDIAVKYGRNIKWLGYLSTMAVNRPNKDGSPLDEDSPLNPVSDYGRSKALAEEFLKQKSDFPTLILRLPGVYGPRDMDFLEYFRIVKKGMIPIVGTGEPQTSLIHVNDVVSALMRGFEKKANGLYYISDGIHYTFRKIGAISSKILKKRAVYVKIPAYIATLFAYVNENFGRANIISREKVKEMTAGNWTCNSSLAERDLDWKPVLRAEHGFEDTIAWYRKNGYL
ncbi:NAD(P)-dependent oxidoreductase [bacterium]|nr:NAD(P)-dependent oxidoreductase [bacterium]